MRDRFRFKNPRLIAVAIAVGCMFIDDLPEPRYNTFHDPGAAAMLSIVFADTITVLGHRRRISWACLVLLLLPLKFFLQPLFWVQNAWFLDTGALLLAHAVLGFLAARNLKPWTRLLCSVATSAYLISLLFVLGAIFLMGSGWVVFYFQLSAERILIPVTFWTVTLFLEARHGPEQLPSNPVPVAPSSPLK